MSLDPATSTEEVAPIVPIATLGEGRRNDSGYPMVTWLCHLLQAGDSFYPTGSYAHSFGLEGLVHAGVVSDVRTLRRFIFSSTLPMLERAELPLVVHAWRALESHDWARVGALCLRSSALKTAREARLASENIGRQRAELCASLHPHSIASEYLQRAQIGRWPFASTVSAALEAHATKAPLDAALVNYSYSSLAALLSAAMKLLRLGQNGAQSLLTETLAAIPASIARAQAVAFEDIGWFSPWYDIASARHESADARMFIS